MANEPLPVPTGDLVLYQTPDGTTRVDVRVQDDTVWLSLQQMADLFQRDKSVVSRHIRNVFAEGELLEEATVANFATVQREGDRSVTRGVAHYNLDVIISVGYRVKSQRGTQFRTWATRRIAEYIVKGFTLDDRRLKEAGGGSYFDELLERIRDIRSSEKVFYRKVLDIYATSADYEPNSPLSREFFATVQNKMHWGAHGHTAAELIRERADASQPNMGLRNWSGDRPLKGDVGVAKNYLDGEELENLNLIVSFYLDFAELQARSGRPMYMRDWVTKLDDFLKLSDRDVLTHLGSVSHEEAMAHAEAEYEKLRRIRANSRSAVEDHFEAAVRQIENDSRSRSQPRGPERPKRTRPRDDSLET